MYNTFCDIKTRLFRRILLRLRRIRRVGPTRFHRLHPSLPPRCAYITKSAVKMGHRCRLQEDTPIRGFPALPAKRGLQGDREGTVCEDAAGKITSAWQQIAMLGRWLTPPSCVQRTLSTTPRVSIGRRADRAAAAHEVSAETAAFALSSVL